jgi:hypothetical protein
MPSSTSSSERLTASDRPGEAQPVPVRDIPGLPWGPIVAAAAMLAALLLGAWEWHWRGYGAVPSSINGDGLWALQRRRIDQGEGDATVLIGSSRVLFDVQLPVWERLAGERPIQLALEGRNPLTVLEDLADDPDFTGRLLVGVAPDVFFNGQSKPLPTVRYYHDESPSQRVGQWLSMQLVEPNFAFVDPDFALAKVLRRLPWPVREGAPNRKAVRKLYVSGPDRATHMWRKVEVDHAYREIARSTWAQDFGQAPPGAETPALMAKRVDEQVGRVAKAVAKLRQRGVPVLFLRAPSSGPYYADEEHFLPRAKSWDVLLERTGAPGIHFMDYPAMRDLNLPEWSHLAHADAERFTAELVRIIQRDFEPGSWPRAGSVAPSKGASE